MRTHPQTPQALPRRRSKVRAADGRRGATLLFFLLVMIPFAMLSMMLSADLTRLVDAQRQAGYVAANAATAGSLQYIPGTSELDQARARQVAFQTAQAGIDAGAMPYADAAEVSVTVQSRTVQVRVRYQLSGLILAPYFGPEASEQRGVSRTADVCLPGETPTAAGFCSRPRAR